MKSFEEFKFVQSFRVPVEKSDDLRFLINRAEAEQVEKGQYYDDVTILDISKTGIGFLAKENFSVGQRISISLQYRRIHLDILAVVVRATVSPQSLQYTQYGLEYDEYEESDIHEFLESFVTSFTLERMRTCMVKMALMDRYAVSAEELDIVSLLISLFKDIIRLGHKEDFLTTVLLESLRNMNAQKAVLYLIDTKTDQLMAQAAVGVSKENMHFDYRVGVAGQIFTSGVALNMDIKKEQGRFHKGQEIPELFGTKEDIQTYSVIGHPIYNRDDKIVGVIEVMERKDQNQFTVEDEKTMKILSMIFSSIYHNYGPMMESSKVRSFAAPVDRNFALVGKSRYIQDLRLSIRKLKDLDFPLLLEGEKGVGKTLYAQILHHEGKRAGRPLIVINCDNTNEDELREQLFAPQSSAFNHAHKGTLLLRHVQMLPSILQMELLSILQERYLPKDKLNVDVRVMATTVPQIERLVAQKKFHPELYKILSTSMVKLPPLRKHMEDLELLSQYFLKVECKKQGYLPKSFSPKALEQLQKYRFGENIKELRTIIERCVRYFPKDHVIDDLGNSVLQVWKNDPDELASVSQILIGHPYLKWEELSFKDQVTLMEKDLLERHLHRFEGNKTQAAKSLGITREGIRKILIKADRLLATTPAQVLEFPNTEDNLKEKVNDKKEAA